jgi:hypothetical protein
MPVSLEAGNWELGVGSNQGSPDQVKYSGDEVRLTLIQNRGPRISTLDKTSYGLYSVNIKACNQPGCITAFYVGPSPPTAAHCCGARPRCHGAARPTAPCCRSSRPH